MIEPHHDPDLAAWLKDTHALHSADWLARALDALYAAGPDKQATKRAQIKLRRALENAHPTVVYYGAVRTKVGMIFAASSERGVMAVGFGPTERDFVDWVRRETGAVAVRSSQKSAMALRQLREYLAGKRTRFDLEVDLSALGNFQRRVLLAALEIPRGQVSTYGEIARRIGRPKAARAVGQALGHNPIPIIIPCHRVLASDGSLGGYSGGQGVKTKVRLLELEGAL